MLQTLFQTIIDYLHNNTNSAGIIVYFITFLESLAIAGTLAYIPGSVVMTAIGILIGSRVIPASVILSCAVFGAITGDIISYWMGRYYKDRIHKIWPFTRYPHWLEKGEDFFKKYGGVSLIVGRFFGPIRCLVPLVAGTFKMRPLIFLLVAIPSASGWAIGYLLPGILIGALSLELPSSLAFKFIGVVLGFLLLAALISWGAHYFFSRLGGTINKKIKNLWYFLQKHKQTHWFTELLTDPHNPENYTQIILLFYAIISGLIFLFIAGNVEYQSKLTFLNEPLFHLLQSLRTNIGDNIFLIVTILGSSKVMVGSTALILTWLVFKRYWRAAIHWLALFLATGWSIHVFKSLFYSSRPTGFLVTDLTSSFPSGHTLLTISLLGFLAALIGQEIPTKKRRIAYIAAIVISIIVGSSRLYLGAHWLTDVLGSLFLGATLILLTTISYKRSHKTCLPVTKFVQVILISFLLTWIVFGVLNFKETKYKYTPNWLSQTQNVALADWQQHINYEPIFRTNRFGKETEAINIEWLGDIENIHVLLERQGWKGQDAALSMIGFLRNISNQDNGFRLPIFPQLYQGQRPSLVMTKQLEVNGKWIIMLRLWKSNIQIQNSSTPMWVGIVNYYKAPPKLFTIKKHKKKNHFLGATDELLPYLKDFHVKIIYYPVTQQPSNIHALRWNGRMLLIYPVEK